MCGSGICHLTEYPKYDTEDLVEEVEKVKNGKKRSTRDIRRIARTILREPPYMSDDVYRIVHDYGFQGIAD